MCRASTTRGPGTVRGSEPTGRSRFGQREATLAVETTATAPPPPLSLYRRHGRYAEPHLVSRVTPLSCRGAADNARTMSVWPGRRSVRIGCATSRRVFTHRGSRLSRGGAWHRFRPDREIRAQDLASIREHGFELCRNRSLVRARVAGGREIPSRHRGCEGAKVRQPGLGVRGRSGIGRIGSAFLHASAEQLRALGIPPIQQRPRLDERRRGNDRSGRADEADLLQVSGDPGVESGHRLRRGEQGNHPPPRLPVDVEIGIEGHD